jgi:hypothetical protein
MKWCKRLESLAKLISKNSISEHERGEDKKELERDENLMVRENYNWMRLA